MATILKRKGKWRVQIRRDGHSLSKTFHLKAAAEEWAREAEHAIDKQIDPSTHKISRRDSFASLIDLHIEDMAAVGKPLRRSKDAVLKRLRAELGDTTLSNMTRERLIMYGRQRAKAGAGPATLAIDISFIGTILTHAAAVHGITVNTEAVNLARIALRRLGLIARPAERERRPTEKELTRLYEHFDANDRYTVPMTRVIKFAIATAMRIDEIFRIEWDTPDERTRTELLQDFRADPSFNDERRFRAPTPRASGIVTNGGVARELPVADALRIRQDLAQKPSFSFAHECLWRVGVAKTRRRWRASRPIYCEASPSIALCERHTPRALDVEGGNGVEMKVGQRKAKPESLRRESVSSRGPKRPGAIMFGKPAAKGDVQRLPATTIELGGR